jgi:hypothetical protein
MPDNDPDTHAVADGYSTGDADSNRFAYGDRYGNGDGRSVAYLVAIPNRQRHSDRHSDRHTDADTHTILLADSVAVAPFRNADAGGDGHTTAGDS